ncbi:hypothetical protein N184_20880 [Sinorhizobium sp. GL28]|nr:hypothetical protein N184_20880 [Sinorhizobium sp. GL28]
MSSQSLEPSIVRTRPIMIVAATRPHRRMPVLLSAQPIFFV